MRESPASHGVHILVAGSDRTSGVLLVMKTRQDLLEPVTARVRALHSYTVPEVTAVPIIGGNPDYFAWIDESVHR